MIDLHEFVNIQVTRSIRLQLPARETMEDFSEKGAKCWFDLKTQITNSSILVYRLAVI